MKVNLGAFGVRLVSPISLRRLSLITLLLGLSLSLAAACGPASDNDAPTSASRPPVTSPTPSEDAAPGPTSTTSPPPAMTERRPSATPSPTEGSLYSDLHIVTLLPRDAIPAILDPEFLEAEDAWEQYFSKEPVLGVSINGEHKAYSVPFLSSREIVNDHVGGVAVAVTW